MKALSDKIDILDRYAECVKDCRENRLRFDQRLSDYYDFWDREGLSDYYDFGESDQYEN